MFDSNELRVLCCADCFTLWHYTTTDEIDIIKSRGYFKTDMLKHGDVIYINCMGGVYHMYVSVLERSGLISVKGVK